jgi:hypothetical protein
VNTIQFTYVEHFTQQIAAYFEEISEMRQLLATTGKLAGVAMTELFDNVHTTNMSGGIKYQIMVFNPQVILLHYCAYSEGGGSKQNIRFLRPCGLWSNLPVQ